MFRNFRELDIFVSVYEERSFTAAARSNNATQSGVSRHIKLLEDELGVSLFQRDKRNVTPTPAGDIFYRRCIELLRSRETAISSLETFHTSLKGQITVGLVAAITRVALGPALLRFNDINPNVSVRIVQGYSSNLAKQVHAEELDFAIAPIAAADSPFLEIRPFLRCPEALVTRRRPGGPRDGDAVPSDLARLNLVIPGGGSPRRRALDQYIAMNKVELRNVLEVDSVTGMLSIINKSDWGAIMSPISICDELDFSNLVVKLLVDPPLLSNFVVIKLKKRNLSPAAESFLAILSQESDSLFEVLKARSDTGFVY